jgi:hypothetical protein
MQRLRSKKIIKPRPLIDSICDVMEIKKSMRENEYFVVCRKGLFFINIKTQIGKLEVEVDVNKNEFYSKYDFVLGVFEVDKENIVICSMDKEVVYLIDRK